MVHIVASHHHICSHIILPRKHICTHETFLKEKCLVSQIVWPSSTKTISHGPCLNLLAQRRNLLLSLLRGSGPDASLTRTAVKPRVSVQIEVSGHHAEGYLFIAPLPTSKKQEPVNLGNRSTATKVASQHGCETHDYQSTILNMTTTTMYAAVSFEGLHVREGGCKDLCIGS